MTRVSTLKDAFVRRFGYEPQLFVASPGRVNLIGEHTDYNDGFVLPMAIERHTLIAAGQPRDAVAPTMRAYSLDLDESDTFELVAQSLVPGEIWTDYIKGVAQAFLARGMPSVALDIVVSTTVPIGCGLSSSAALQVAMARVFQQLAPNLVADNEVAALCQAAEFEFTGMPAGIMDQYCVANARKDHLVYLDCRSLDAEHVHFDDPDVAVLIIDSKVSRELRDGAYARRREQCSQACETLGVSHLRDATVDQVMRAREALTDVPFRRALHVTSEDERTARTVAAIRERRWVDAGKEMYESHRSMAKDFEITVADIDLLVELARGVGVDGGVYGSRMTGGGFGGCTVSLIERQRVDEIIGAMAPAYAQATGRELEFYMSSPAQGAHVLNRPEDLS